jgi:predicted exporter
LQQDGVTPQEIKKLREVSYTSLFSILSTLSLLIILCSGPSTLSQAGIFTIQGILCKSMRELLLINGLSEAKITKIIALAKKQATGHHTCPGSFVTGLQVQEQRKSIRR